MDHHISQAQATRNLRRFKRQHREQLAKPDIKPNEIGLLSNRLSNDSLIAMATIKLTLQKRKS